jgi:hypothetical protein
MLAVIKPDVLPALRIAGTFFLINILAFIYIFGNRHRFSGEDPNACDDIPAVRKTENRGRSNPVVSNYASCHSSD